MNGSINVLKFIFAMAIFFLHCGTIYGYDQFEWFQGAFIYVEWFYIFMGYTLTKKIRKLSPECAVCETSARIIWDRMKGLLPFYFIACTLALGTQLLTGRIVLGDAWMVHQVVFEYLMMQMTTLPVVLLTHDSWFLSSMWISFVILVPLMIRFRHRFTRYGILITVIIYLYIFFRSGHLYNPGEWLPLTYKGNLRAIAAICLGMTAAEWEKALIYRRRYPRTENLMALLVYAAILAFTFFWHESRWNDIVYFLIPFLFMLLIAVQMSGKETGIIPDNRITQFMGKISMVIYMNHVYILMAVGDRFGHWPVMMRAAASLILTLSASTLVYILGTKLLNYAGRKKGNARKMLNM